MLLPARLFKRSLDSNKGDFGNIFILAGSASFTGAAFLCSLSAMRAGAGAVTLGLPKSIHPILASKLTEVMTLPLPETSNQTLSEAALGPIRDFIKKTDCVLMGPGLSQDPYTQNLIRKVISICDKPMILDADALNALAGHMDILKALKNDVVLTPHPGELARLLNTSVESVQKNRKEVAKDFTLRYNVVLVLKGFETLVVEKKEKLFVNSTGNPGMATAGSGDVLSGILAAFIAQGLNIYEAAKAAVYVHGLAGDLVAKDKTQISLIASDIIEYLPEAFKKSRKNGHY